MITQYHRPQTLDEALKILSRPNTVPLGGGTLLSHGQPGSVEVVDLQSLGLNSIRKNGNTLEIGATATLQQLLEEENCAASLKSALKLEAPLNLRNAASVAGAIVTCAGGSTFVTALLALDAKMTVLNPEPKSTNLGDYLPLRPAGLITSISIPLNVNSAFEYVARAPDDNPVVCIALARWKSGRTRLAVGGYGKAPRLAMDGTEAEGLESAARNAFYGSDDEWASAEYRMDVAATLAGRCFTGLQNGNDR